MFREADDGENKGPVSMRRVLSFILALAALGLFTGGFFFAEKAGWYVFIPGAACLITALAFLILTTIGDVQMIIAAWKGK
jgi:hypothetical protein